LLNITAKTAKKQLVKFRSAIKGFIYGATVYGMIQRVKGEKLLYEYTLMSVTIGDVLGLPIFTSYYKLKVLPHWVQRIESCWLRIHRERDIFEKLD